MSGKSDKTVSEFVQVLEGLERFVAPPVGRSTRLLRFVRDLRDVLAAQPGVQASEVISALRRIEPGSQATGKPRRAQLDPAALRELPLDEATVIVDDPSTTKRDLLALAQHRFEGQRGPLQKLSKDSLRERILEMVEAEMTHASIGRMAASSGGGEGTPP